MQRILRSHSLRPREQQAPADATPSPADATVSNQETARNSPGTSDTSVNQPSHASGVPAQSADGGAAQAATNHRKRKGRRRKENDFDLKRTNANNAVSAPGAAVLDGVLIPEAAVLDAVLIPEAAVFDAVLIPEAAIHDAVLIPEAAVLDAVLIPEAAIHDAVLIPEAAVLDAVLIPEAAVLDAVSMPEAAILDALLMPEAGPCDTQCVSHPKCCQGFKAGNSRNTRERTLRRRHRLWKDGDRRSERLVVKNLKFPFHELPYECKMKIFASLEPVCKGVAAQVCRDWRELMADPDSWQDIDLDFLSSGLTCYYYYYKYCQSIAGSPVNVATARARYDVIETRMESFVALLSSLKPRIRSLAFQFDLGRDYWYFSIQALLKSSDLKRLESLEIDWQNTPLKPPCLDSYCCNTNKLRRLFRLHVTRVIIFHKMLQILTQRAKDVRSISMPFDWSARAVLLVSRWRALKSVMLLPYLSFRDMEQTLLDAFLRSHSELVCLILSIRIPRLSSTTLYSMSHRTLERLDLTACKGFYLHHVDLPSLRVLHLSHHPWRGVLVGENNRVPCSYQVMVGGMPKLQTVNKHRLTECWRVHLDDELEALLRQLCVCPRHCILPSNQ